MARQRLVFLLFLAAIGLLRGSRLLSAWYNDLGSLSLAVEWRVVREALPVPSCQRWGVGTAAAGPVGQALRLDARNQGARLNAGRVAWLLGDCETALDNWGNFSSNNDVARLERANGLYALGRREEALTLFREIGGVAGYFSALGKRAEAAKDSDAAVGCYELSFAIMPTRGVAQTLALSYLEREQPEAAMVVWRQLIEATDESTPDHWWAVGQLAELTEQWQTAANAYERGAEVSEASCEFRQRQETCLEQLGHWAVAEEVCRKALDACPNWLWPYLRLGYLRSEQGDDTGALFWYRRGESLSPQGVSAKYYVGALYYRQGSYEQAKEYFQQALALNPRHSWSTYYLAWCFYQMEEKQAAVAALSRAIELHAGQPWQWAILLGDWRSELRDWKGALAAYRQALQWHPGDETVQQRIRGAFPMGAEGNE
jgi:tetratricopeptide (TPR) repeat protein